MSATVADSGRLTVLLIAPERNGWVADIIWMWPMWRDRPLADRDVEDRQMLVGELRGADDRAPSRSRSASICSIWGSL